MGKAQGRYLFKLGLFEIFADRFPLFPIQRMVAFVGEKNVVEVNAVGKNLMDINHFNSPHHLSPHRSRENQKREYQR
jgi:hypothetical protein